MNENAKAANFGDIILNLDTNCDINCQLIKVKPTEHNPKGNRFQKCVLWDGYDNKDVKIWEGRNGMPLEEKNVKEWLTFSLSARAGTGKWANQTYLGGFWDSATPIINAPQVPPQTPQNAPQSTNDQQLTPQAKKEPDWDAKDQRNANMNALNNATSFLTTCAVVSNNIASYLSEGKIKDIAASFAEFIYTNKTKPKQMQKCQECGAEDVTQCNCTPW